MTERIYLDNSATTMPSAFVMACVDRCMQEAWYNPSALYRPAMIVQKSMDEARRLCLAAVDAEGEQCVFTSGGTEADNLAILGHIQRIRQKGRVLIYQSEHPAVTACIPEIEHMGFQVETIAPDHEGIVDLNRLEKQMGTDVVLMVIMQVNNETGAIQPIQDIAQLRDQKCPDAAIHVDGVQGFLRVPFSMHALNIQSYALSGHKIHGLKGTGALIYQKQYKLAPRMLGGGQEMGVRSGTENTIGILALGEAIRTYPKEANAHMCNLKHVLYDALRERVPGLRLNGPEPGSAASAPHILNVSLCPVRSQTMMFALEGDGILVSAGSACSSHRQKVSPVLTAMGISPMEADCAIRFSLCYSLTERDIQTVAERVQSQYQVLAKYTRR